MPGAPDPQLTHPTTHLQVSSFIPQKHTARRLSPDRPQHPHWPLYVTLVLTQFVRRSVYRFAVVISQGGSAALTDCCRGMRRHRSGWDCSPGCQSVSPDDHCISVLSHSSACGISWLSREIVAFGAFAKLASGFAALLWLREPTARLGDVSRPRWWPGEWSVSGLTASLLGDDLRRHAAPILEL